MDLWSTYTHCFRSEDLDAMRGDAQRLGLEVNTTDSAEDPIHPESNEPVPPVPIFHLSADPAAWLPPVHFALAKPQGKWDA
jgi:hypothetical protein